MIALLLFVLTTMVIFPSAPTSRLMHRLLVEPCARWLNRLSWVNLALVAGVIAGGGLMTLLFGPEGLRVYGMMASEALLWFSLVDGAILIDLLVVGTAMGAVARVRTIHDAVVERLRPIVRVLVRAARPRAPRTRPATSVRTRRSDDPDPAARAYAG